MTDTFDIPAYRRRIGFDGPIEQTLECLARLMHHHASAIPFENIEVLARRVPALDDAGLQAKLVQRRRGGYCFEQNKLFRGVLQASGFAVAPMEARIRAGVPADVSTGRTHLATRVTLAGVDHLVDVGCGGIAPLAPLPLASRAEHAAGTGRYRFVDADADLLLQAATPDGWVDCYRIAPGAPLQIDCELANWFVATHPLSMLGHNLLVARAIPGGRLRLFNARLSTYRPESAAPSEQTLATRAEFADAFADGFGLDIADADLDAVMAVLERQQAA
ncbi:MAG: arylamine N-acetyltransferase [Betaproteobacteria bacterium]